MTHSATPIKTAHAAPRKATRRLPIDGPRPLGRLIATLTAGVTALSLMLATALPAHADRQSDNLAKALVAALAIGAIVHSIDKGHAAPAPAPAPTPVRGARVPAVCAIEVSGARRDVTFYPERCLRREGFDYRLPRDCAIDIRIRGRVDRAYGERCLRDAGFRVGGRDGRDGRGHGRGTSGY